MSTASWDAIEHFLAALAAGGIELAPGQSIVPDGRLHRVRLAADRPGQRTGWYRLHIDPPPAGVAGDWRTGCQVKWCSKRAERLSPAERGALRRRIERERADREAEDEARYRKAARRGAWIWRHAKPAAVSHDYLQRKGLEPGIARQCEGMLILPVLDFSGYLRGVQYIHADGQKRFLRGMKKAGAFIPVADRPDGTRPLWIAEGWATACTLQVSSPFICAIAGLDAGNLRSVAMEARRRWPALDIVVCPDFDPVGTAKGRDAALAAQACILPPPIEIPEGATDWNDLMATRKGVTHA
ncbi:toprim domain-containing protein [Acidithiobacillus caldus]|uniref:toprim domain-containing protein n=1 Tax=Acidithiobacillus caldus TaxID=33059 RepID=UPI0009837F37|nr:toprim domain-containing protein [Acidithiobacillus caldus]